jgi:hypothetical protein
VRQALAALAALLVLGAVVWGGYQALEGSLAEEEAAGDEPDATVDAYLTAWEEGDHETMRELVRDAPPTFIAAHDQLRDGIGVTDLSIERTELNEDVDGRATAMATVTAELEQVAEPISWAIEVQLLRERRQWGVAWSPAALHPEWRPGLQFVTTTAPAERAPILAHDGTELASNGERVVFGFEPAGVDSRDEIVAAFEEAVEGSGETADRLLRRGDLVDGWFYPVVSLSAAEAAEVGTELTGVPGILRRTESGARNLLAPDFAVHVVGRTGEATAEELENLGPPYEAGDHIGRTGLEAVLERRLAEREQLQVQIRDGIDGPVKATLATATLPREGDEEDLDAGPVTTTLDVSVQRAVENALVGRRAPTAMVVVDAEDGAVRASASRPIDGYNRAFEGRYPPGSVFAPVVVEALVAAGGDPTTTVNCPQEGIYAGRRVENAGGANLGEAPLPEAARAGCATSLASLGLDLGGDASTQAAARFGAGVAPIVPLFANGFSFPEPVDLGEAAVAAAGQGRVEISPLHLASVAAATSTGSWWPPYLLEDDGPGSAVQLAPGALDGLQRLMGGGGAEGDGAALTGFAGAASGTDDAVHAWFIGTVDGLGVAVLLEGQGETAEAAALAERFATELAELRTEDEG